MPSWFDQFGPEIERLPGNENPQTPFQTKVGAPVTGSGGGGRMYAGGSPSFDEFTGQYVTPGTGSMPVTMAGGAGGQDPRAFFQSLFPGDTLSPQDLAAKEAELQRAGIRLLGPNAAGMRTKIELPNGQIVDVIGGAGSGKNRNQWMIDSGGGGGGNLPPGFQTGMFTGGGQYPLASVMGTGLMAPWTTPFKAPNVTDDPGFQFRMQEGQKALERSAAAKGTLLSGGTLKDLAGFAQGLASQEYGNAYNRALGQYTMAHDIFSQNQQNQFNRLGSIAGVGQTATGQLGQFASGYAGRAGDLITGAGNAAAAGQVGAANAWSGALGNIGNMAGTMGMYYGMTRQPQPQNGFGPGSIGGSFYY